MNKKWIKISSGGTIDERFFSLLGASTKRDQEGKIGYFGSGLKYSIAYLLRHGVYFKVFSGTNEIIFGTEDETIGNKTFKSIVVNGRKTDITTDFGPNWEKWMIIRELLANAIDEGNHSFEDVEEIIQDESKTSIYVDYNYFADVYSNFDDYFSFNRKIISTIIVKAKSINDSVTINILRKTDVNSHARFYRKGFLVYTNEYSKSYFDYDVSDCSINEERIASNTYELYSNILTALISSELISDINFGSNMMQNSFEHVYIANEYFNKLLIDFNNLLKAIGDKTMVPYEAIQLFDDIPNSYILPTNLLIILRDKYGIKSVLKGDAKKMFRYASSKDLETVDMDIFLDALRISKQYMHRIFPEFKFPTVSLGVFHDEDYLGMVLDNNEIVISTKQGSVLNFVERILEEVFHIESGQGDRTRGFQNYVIKRIGEFVVTLE